MTNYDTHIFVSWNFHCVWWIFVSFIPPSFILDHIERCFLGSLTVTYCCCLVYRSCEIKCIMRHFQSRKRKVYGFALCSSTASSLQFSLPFRVNLDKWVIQVRPYFSLNITSTVLEYKQKQCVLLCLLVCLKIHHCTDVMTFVFELQTNFIQTCQ